MDEQHQAVRDMVEGRLTLHKNVRWEMTDYAVDEDPDRDETRDIEEAEAVSSLMRSPSRPGGFHDLLIDIDQFAMLVPSSTPGHFHLYAKLGCPWEDYLAFLKAAAKIGLIEPGYVHASEARGATSLRLPWIKKGEEREAVENGGKLPPKRRPAIAELPEAPF